MLCTLYQLYTLLAALSRTNCSHWTVRTVRYNMLSTGEQQELNRLRDKYKDGHGVADTLGLQDAGAAKQAACAADDSLAHVHLCHSCQGSGVHTELYEFRRLESTCKHCSGEGVLVTGNSSCSQHSKQRKGIAANSNYSSMASKAAGAGAAETGQSPSVAASAPTQPTANKRRVVRELPVLEEKIVSITQEKAGLIAALAASASSTSHDGNGSMQQDLQENLVEQLQRHLDDLMAARTARQAGLGAA